MLTYGVIFILIKFISVSTANMSAVFKLNTGYEIPLIGLGTYLISGQEKTNNVVDLALSAGYRLFDTAEMYSNERYLGEAFKIMLPKHGLTREDIFITTKFGKPPCHFHPTTLIPNILSCFILCMYSSINRLQN